MYVLIEIEWDAYDYGYYHPAGSNIGRPVGAMIDLGNAMELFLRYGVQLFHNGLSLVDFDPDQDVEWDEEVLQELGMDLSISGNLPIGITQRQAALLFLSAPDLFFALYEILPGKKYGPIIKWDRQLLSERGEQWLSQLLD